MFDFANIVAGLSILLLAAAVLVWTNRSRVSLRLINGRSVELGQPEIASRFLVAGAAVSVIAAVIAIAGWFAA